MKKVGRQAINLNVVAEEARLLSAIWFRTPIKVRGNQAAFGEKFGIGNQSAVGQFIRGEIALSFKAARGFAEGLGCAIADFSPRLAQEAELNAQFASGSATPNQSVEISELTNVVTRLTSTGQMQLTEVQAMIAMLKAREGAPKP